MRGPVTTAPKVEVPGITVGLATVRRRQSAGKGGGTVVVAARTDRALSARATGVVSVGTDKSIAPFSL